jgi:DNA polymerase elongation subunit (family B)
MKNKHLIYGIDEEENIVGIETLRNQNVVQIFKRENGEIKSRFEPFKYFIYVNSGESFLEKVKEFQSATIKPLLGGNYYDTLVETNDIGDIFTIKKYTKNSLIPYTSSQYQLSSGKTLFKGMTAADVLTLYVDIETNTKKGYEFSNSQRKEDKVFIIACKTNDGRKRVFHLEHEDISDDFNVKDVEFVSCKKERDLLVNFIAYVRQVDPDVIANHNIFNFDFTYLLDRCRYNDVEFAIGRDGSEPNTFDTSIKFADKSAEYKNFDVYGRSVIDTQFLAMYVDVVKRNMPSYRLKDLVKYLGKAKADRVYIEGSEISKIFRGESDKSMEDLLRYAIDDVIEAEVLYKEFGASYFIMTKMIPMSYQEVFRYGTGNQVEYVFMREYYRCNWSYPVPDPKKEYGGGYADVLEFGLIKEPIIYADVKSLYPSLAKLLKIQPKKDELGIFQKILNLLMETRFAIKDNIKKYSKEGKQDLVNVEKATDGSVKIFLNTMSYGYIGWSYGSFNDYGEAARITENGQRVVKEMDDLIIEDGGRPIKVDTDGVACVVPEKYRGSKESEEEYIDTLTDRLEEGIIIEHDGRYKGIIAFDKKSYALLNYDDTIDIKGNTIRGRTIESFGIDFFNSCIENLFNGDHKSCIEKFKYYENRLSNKEMEAYEVQKKGSLNFTLEEYKNKTEGGNTNPIAAYELAIKSDKHYQKGDILYYYVKEFPYIVKQIRNKPQIRKQKMKIYEAAEFIDNYNYDYEESYYQERLQKFCKKFMILGKDLFEDVFGDLFLSIKASDKRRYNELTGNKYEV